MGEKRDAYVSKLKSQLDEWNATIDRMEEAAKVAKLDAELEYRNRLAKLRTRRDELRDKISELQDAGEDAWQTLKDGAEKAQHELKMAFDDAKQRFKGDTQLEGPRS